MNQSHPDRIEGIEEFFADFEDASRNEDWQRYGEMFLPEFTNMDPRLRLDRRA